MAGTVIATIGRRGPKAKGGDAELIWKTALTGMKAAQQMTDEQTPDAGKRAGADVGPKKPAVGKKASGAEKERQGADVTKKAPGAGAKEKSDAKPKQAPDVEKKADGGT
jgi:hypothetical protein